MKNIENYDIIKDRYRFSPDDLDDILLLHPAVIADELEKVKKKCPFYVVERNGKSCDVFIPNMGITSLIHTHNMTYYIPTLIPVSGVDGKYSIIISRAAAGKRTSNIRGYDVIDNETGRTLIVGDHLNYLGRGAAAIDKFIITKNSIIPYDGRITPIFLEETGCLSLSVSDEKGVNMHYLFYDNEGNYVTTDFIYNDVFSTNKHFPKLPTVDYPKNQELFEKMIVTSLRDTEQLDDCDSDNLIDIANHFQEKGLQVAINLDSLTVYKVNYDKYFRKINAQQNQQPGQQYVYKKSGSESNS